MLDFICLDAITLCSLGAAANVVHSVSAGDDGGAKTFPRASQEIHEALLISSRRVFSRKEFMTAYFFFLVLPPPQRPLNPPPLLFVMLFVSNFFLCAYVGGFFFFCDCGNGKHNARSFLIYVLFCASHEHP